MKTLFHAVALSFVLGIGSYAHNTAYATDISTTYASTCGVCHDQGNLNAPKKGDKAAWQRLITQKGMAALVKSTKDGMPQMPARGLCNSCSDEDFAALIDYMAK